MLEITMNDIPEKFTREGLDYELIKRHGNLAAMYEVKHNGTIREYEVWKLRIHAKDKLEFGIRAGDIRKPTTKEWGRYGWTFVFIESAEKKFGRLINEMSKS